VPLGRAANHANSVVTLTPPTAAPLPGLRELGRDRVAGQFGGRDGRAAELAEASLLLGEAAASTRSYAGSPNSATSSA
jgi:hypothetical protein